MRRRFPVQIERHREGLRLYVSQRRCHHGVSGIAITVVGLVTHNKLVVAAGVGCMVHDLPDWRDWSSILFKTRPLFT